MKRILVFIVIIFFANKFLDKENVVINVDKENRSYAEIPDELESTISRAYKNHQSNIQVNGSGLVSRILPDDTKGSQHQRFILRLSSGQTILIAHNIDLAPKINSLQEGDRVEFYGEYEWNNKGGVVHWTHHAPNNQHEAGWLKHKNAVYQ